MISHKLVTHLSSDLWWPLLFYLYFCSSLSQIILKQILAACFIHEYFSIYLKDKDFLKDNNNTIIVVVYQILKKYEIL